MRTSRKSQKTKKRQRGGEDQGFLSKVLGAIGIGSKETPPAVVSVESNIHKGTATVNSAANAAAMAPSPHIASNGATTKLTSSRPPNVIKMGGMAPINMKEPMFYPTPRQLEWATTAGLPTKGGSRRNKKSKRKSRR